MMELPHQLDRTVVIQAAPETVFRFFQESPRWARWWGAGSTIDPRPGGKVYIRHPNGVETVGEVLEVSPPERIVFTYGYASGNPIPPGASRVTIRLAPDPAGTRLRLFHEFADTGARDQHVQGWRFQLSLFGNVVADEAFAGADVLVDRWFAAWALSDPAARDAEFDDLVAPAITFHDRYSMLEGIDDVTAHVAAAQRFMPGIRMERAGSVRHCQGAVLADWVAKGGDGKEVMAGTNVFLLGPDAKFTAITGFQKEAK
jgi:uncharacterized protein YndB with AHSA1/START domain